MSDGTHRAVEEFTGREVCIDKLPGQVRRAAEHAAQSGPRDHGYDLTVHESRITNDVTRSAAEETAGQEACVDKPLGQM